MRWFSKSLVVVYLSAIFAAGAVSGWVVAERRAKTRVVTPPRPDEISKSFKERVHSRISLSEDQRKKVDRIIERSSAEIQAVHSDHIKSLRVALDNRNAQIKGLLNPEQQQLFAQLLSERHDPWKGKRNWEKSNWQGRGRSGRGESSKSKNPVDCPTNAPGRESLGKPGVPEAKKGE